MPNSIVFVDHPLLDVILEIENLDFLNHLRVELGAQRLLSEGDGELFEKCLKMENVKFQAGWFQVLIQGLFIFQF
jgi:hypothetical protein